jgi:hypothetical protein
MVHRHRELKLQLNDLNLASPHQASVGRRWRVASCPGFFTDPPSSEGKGWALCGSAGSLAASARPMVCYPAEAGVP